MVDENYRFNNEEIHNSSIEFNIDITSDVKNNFEEVNVVLEPNECSLSDGSSETLDDVDSYAIINNEEESNNPNMQTDEECLYTTYHLENKDFNKLEDSEELACTKKQVCEENKHNCEKVSIMNEQPGNAHHNEPLHKNDYIYKKEMLHEGPINSGKSLITRMDITLDRPNVVLLQHEKKDHHSNKIDKKDTDLLINPTQHNLIKQTDKIFSQNNKFEPKMEDTLQIQLEYTLTACNTKDNTNKILEKDTFTVDVNNKNIQELESCEESHETRKKKFVDNNCLPFEQKVDVKVDMKDDVIDDVIDVIDDVIDDMKDDVKDDVIDVIDDIKDNVIDVIDHMKDDVKDDMKDDMKEGIKVNVKDDVKDDMKDDIKDNVIDVIDHMKDDVKDDMKDDLNLFYGLIDAENENVNTINCSETSCHFKQNEALRTFAEERENINDIPVKEDNINVSTEIEIVENVATENIKTDINDENMINFGQKVVKNNDVFLEQEEKELIDKVIEEKETNNVLKTIDNRGESNEKKLIDVKNE
ncbi:hypothetical protein COBT_003482, partial [Conglomerata obtusa]